MKKIYLLLSVCILNFGFGSATSPVSSCKKNSKNSPQSDQANSSGGSRFGKSRGQIPITIGTKSLARIGHGGHNQINLSVSYLDDFDGANDTTSLQARGYKTYFRGEGVPGLRPCWFQGDTNVFPSFNGPDSGYVVSNFQSVGSDSIYNIDNWLVLPSLSVSAGNVLSFYSQSPPPLISPTVDSIWVYYSEVGDSVPEALTWVLLDSFEVNTNHWEYDEFAIPTTSSNARFAIRYAVVDGGLLGPNSNYIGIDHLEVKQKGQTDGEITEIFTPKSGCSLSAAEQVTLEIYNQGNDTLKGFDLSFAVDGGVPIVESFTDSIAPRDTAYVTFSATADVSATGQHWITGSFINANDSNSINDVWTDTLFNMLPSPDPLTTLYSMNFELSDDFTGWVVEDLNPDGVTWDTVSVNAHNGSYCMRKTGSGADDDDWLYSKCFNMTAGSNYYLDFWYVNFNYQQPCSLEVWIGTSQNAGAMTQQLVQCTIDSLYHHGVALAFTVPNSGAYHLGFHAFSSYPTTPGSSSIRVDYINLDDGTFNGINENPSEKNISIYPNPTNGVFGLYSTTLLKKVLLEVFDINGRLVYQNYQREMLNQTIDLSKMPAGIYNVRITTDSFVKNQRITLSK